MRSDQLPHQYGLYLVSWQHVFMRTNGLRKNIVGNEPALVIEHQRRDQILQLTVHVDGGKRNHLLRKIRAQHLDKPPDLLVGNYEARSIELVGDIKRFHERWYY